MPYRLQSPISPRDEVLRVARGQIDRARAEIDASNLNAEDKVHQIRKRCKKLRALLRLVRPALGGRFGRENTRYRDIGRRLSAQRDADVLLETHDEIVSGDRSEGEGPDVAGVRKLIAERGADVEKRPVAELLGETEAALRQAEGALETWFADNALELEDIAGGMAKTYRRGRKALDRANQSASAEAFHEWRKRAKYHFYHLQLLQAIWPALVKARRKQAKRVSDWLGDEHDLSVYIEAIGKLEDPSLYLEALAYLQDLALQRRDALRAEALGVGERLWAEKPGKLADRMMAYWQAWRAEALRGR
jgi:CHAD domain-containing protein